MPFPLLFTHPNSTSGITQYFGAKNVLMDISSKVSLKSLFLTRLFTVVPDLLFLSCIIAKIDITPYSASAWRWGVPSAQQYHVVSPLWTLPFSSLSQKFYRISTETIHFGYLIIYYLHSCLKLYMLCICLRVLL